MFNTLLAGMCQAFVVGAVVTHVMPYLSSLGIERSLSSVVALIVPFVSIVGRMSNSWLSERMSKKILFITGFALLTVGLLLFTYVSSNSIWLLVPFILTFSIGWGITALTRIALVREYFGISSFGKIFGLQAGIFMIGSMSGSPVAGWVYDTWQSYHGAWLSLSVVNVVAMLVILALPSKASSQKLEDSKIISL